MSSLTLSFAVGVVVFLCVMCLLASFAILVRAQELHTQSLELFGLVYDWIEQNSRKEETK